MSDDWRAGEKPARTPFRDMSPTQKTSYVIGAAIAAGIGVGVLAIIAGLLWRGIRAVWGLA